MIKWNDIPMKIKLISLFLILSIVPLAIVGFSAYNNAQEALAEQAKANLDSVAYLKRTAIEGFFDDTKNNLNAIAKTNDVKDAIHQLVQYHKEMEIQATGNYDMSSSKNVTKTYDEIWNELNEVLKVYPEEYGYNDIMIICAPHGHVMYTWAKKNDLGSNLGAGIYRDSVLADVWSNAKQKNGYFITDIEPYAAINGEPAMFAAAPVHENGNIIGVIALQIPQTKIDGIMQQAEGMGETGETYLVGPDYLFRSNSRLSSENTLLSVEVKTRGAEQAFKSKDEFEGIYGDYTTKADADKQGRHFSKELGGIPVLGMTMYLPMLDWVLMAEIDEAEAFAKVNALKITVLIIAIIASLIVAVIAYFIALSIIKPIKNIADESKELGETIDFSKKFSVLGTDEIGQMAFSLNKMMDEVNVPFAEMKTNAERIATGDLTVKYKENAKGDILKLRNAIEKMVSSMETLIGKVKVQAEMAASSAEELSASSEEVNASSEQVSSTIQEIAKGGQNLTKLSSETRETVNEVAESSKIVAENSQKAAEGAVNAGKAAEKGMKFGESAKEVIHQIMKSTQNTTTNISNLDSKSKEIGKITDVINNISEQTNLLALNAAIEAARAGDAGRGFAVVADEVRKLAEETQKATTQIADMITSIQNGTNSSVNDMTQASKIVEEGGNVIEEALKSLGEITKISKDVEAQVKQVSFAAQESSAGMDKIKSAIKDVSATAEESAASTEEVSASMQETTSSITQVSSAAQNLSKGAEELKQLIMKFKVSEPKKDE